MMTYDQIFDPPVTFLIRFRKANGIRSIANNSPLVALILLTATCNISSSAQAGGGRFLVSCRIDFVISRFIEKAGTCHMLVFRFRFLFVALSDWQKTSVCVQVEALKNSARAGFFRRAQTVKRVRMVPIKDLLSMKLYIFTSVRCDQSLISSFARTTCRVRENVCLILNERFYGVLYRDIVQIWQSRILKFSLGDSQPRWIWRRGFYWQMESATRTQIIITLIENDLVSWCCHEQLFAFRSAKIKLNDSEQRNW